MPKVSIVVPLYNKSKYISATLDSILKQNFSDYEVVVVDDGSTDRSLEIVSQYVKRDCRFHVISIPNGGVSNARNIGLMHAQGEWIQFLDGDDLIDQDYLIKAVDMAEKSGVDILFTNFWMIDENKKKVKEISNTQQGVLDQEKLCQNYMEHQYKNGFFGYISNKLFRRTLWEKSKAKFPVDIKLAEDLDFYAQLYPMVQKAYCAPINSFYYLQTDTNYLNKSLIDYFSQLRVQLDIRKWFVRVGRYQEYKEILDRKVSEYVFFVLFHSKENGQDTKGFFDKIVSNSEIMECIHPKDFSGFEQNVLWAVFYKNYIMLTALLCGRRAIRAIYRRVRKIEENISL